LAIRDVQVDDVSLALARHQPERGHGQVAVRIDQHHRATVAARLHQVVHHAQQQARLASARLGHCQQVAPQQRRRQVHWD
jgi:hypothetical protein